MLSSLPAADLSKAAPAVLVTLVVLSPWPFGSAHPRATQAIAQVTLLAALVLLIALGRRAPSSPRSVLAPLVGLWLLAGLQLVPFPQSVLEGLAPGPSAVWYPGDPVAAGVLGSGAHPLSVHPEATTRWLAFATGLGVLALLAAPALKERRALMRVAVVTVSGGVLVAVYGLLARVLFHDKLYGLLTVPTLAPFGPFVSKNHFAGYVEMAACLAVGLATGLADEAKRGPGRLLGWLDSPRAARVVFAGGAAGVARAGRPRLALARRHREPRRGARGVRPRPDRDPAQRGGESPRPRRRGGGSSGGRGRTGVGSAARGALPRHDPHPHPGRRARPLPARRVARLAPARGVEPSRRLRARRLRGRAAPLQDGSGRPARRARRERLRRAAGRGGRGRGCARRPADRRGSRRRSAQRARRAPPGRPRESAPAPWPGWRRSSCTAPSTSISGSRRMRSCSSCSWPSSFGPAHGSTSPPVRSRGGPGRGGTSSCSSFS